MSVKWNLVAPLMSDIFGVEYDPEEGYFRCVDCDEPIYECDYPELELLDDEVTVVCPICGDRCEIF